MCVCAGDRGTCLWLIWYTVEKYAYTRRGTSGWIVRRVAAYACRAVTHVNTSHTHTNLVRAKKKTKIYTAMNEKNAGLKKL